MAVLFEVPKCDESGEIEGALALVREESRAHFATERYAKMVRIRDQWAGDKSALSETYHPPLPGLSEEQQERVNRARTHINLVEPALDRLVNSIHAGKVSRQVSTRQVKDVVDSLEHREAMVNLCESAFAFGTAVLAPVWREGEVRYWFPNPMTTLLAVNPMDVTDLRGIVELVVDPLMMNVVGVRALTANWEGVWTDGAGWKTEEQDWGFLPAVVAYGRSQLHVGKKYGRSLVAAAADASVKMTGNQTNLELLRDRQTGALLVVKGEPVSTSADNKEANQAYMVFDNEKFGAEYIQPNAQLEQVIKVSERIATNTSVSTGLPLDTFLPEKITGSDASATAARQRAFPLTQRMVRLVNAWRGVENRTTAVIAGLLQHDKGGRSISLAGLKRDLKIDTAIMPNVAEAESETLANWIQRVANYFSRVEDAVEYYGEALTPEARQELVQQWKLKNELLQLTQAGVMTAEEVRVKLGMEAMPKEEKPPEIFQYHIQGGIVTPNEVRRTLNLGPVPEGDKLGPAIAADGSAPATSG